MGNTFEFSRRLSFVYFPLTRPAATEEYCQSGSEGPQDEARRSGVQVSVELPLEHPLSCELVYMKTNEKWRDEAGRQQMTLPGLELDYVTGAK